MKDHKQYLERKLFAANIPWYIAWTSLIIGIGSVVLLIIYHVKKEPFEESSEWTGPFYGGALIGLLLSYFLFRTSSKTRSRYKDLLKDGEFEEKEIAVKDKIQYIRMLPGDEGALEWQYYLGDEEGNWLLNNELQKIFPDVLPGDIIKAVTVKTKILREIVDLEIVKKVKPPSVETKDVILDKVASEVKVTGYENGNYLVNKLHLVKQVRYYFLVNGEPQEVSPEEFKRDKIYSRYSKP